MGQGKNNVVMGTGQQAGFLSLQPALDLELIALGAKAVFTGVIPHPLDMSFWAGLDMPAEGGGAAML